MIGWPIQGPATVSNQGLNACLIPQAILVLCAADAFAAHSDSLSCWGAMPHVFARSKNLISIETQKTLNSQSNLEKEKQQT